MDKASSFLNNCAKSNCAAGDFTRDSSILLHVYATYCYNAGFTQPGLVAIVTSAAADESEANPKPTSAPKGASDSQPSRTADGDTPATSTRTTIVTETKDSGATGSQGTFLLLCLVAVLPLLQVHG